MQHHYVCIVHPAKSMKLDFDDTAGALVTRVMLSLCRLVDTAVKVGSFEILHEM